MRAEIRDQILGYISDMKRLSKNPQLQTPLDRLAVEIITADCRPLVMESGLKAWMRLKDA